MHCYRNSIRALRLAFCAFALPASACAQTEVSTDNSPNLSSGREFLLDLLFGGNNRSNIHFPYRITAVTVSLNGACHVRKNIGYTMSIYGLSPRSVRGRCMFDLENAYKMLIESEARNPTTLHSIQFTSSHDWSDIKQFHATPFREGYFSRTRDCRLFLGHDRHGRANLAIIAMRPAPGAVYDPDQGPQHECMVRGTLVADGLVGAATIPFDRLASRNPTLCRKYNTCASGGVRNSRAYGTFRQLNEFSFFARASRVPSVTRSEIAAIIDEIISQSPQIKSSVEGVGELLRNPPSDTNPNLPPVQMNP